MPQKIRLFVHFKPQIINPTRPIGKQSGLNSTRVNRISAVPVLPLVVGIRHKLAWKIDEISDHPKFPLKCCDMKNLAIKIKF